MNVCAVCGDERAGSAEFLLDGRWVHSWHVSELRRNVHVEGASAIVELPPAAASMPAANGLLGNWQMDEEEERVMSKTNGRPVSFDVELLKKLYAEGLSDRLIGERLGGLHASCVLYHRHKLGLRATAAGGRPKKAQGPRRAGVAMPAVDADVPEPGAPLKMEGRVPVKLSGDVLDAIWARFSLREKGQMIEKFFEG